MACNIRSNVEAKLAQLSFNVLPELANMFFHFYLVESAGDLPAVPFRR